MDYEKYKNALEKAKVRYNEIKDTNCNEEKFLLELFPELKESEDERIRKAILKGLIDCRDAPDLEWTNFGGIKIDDCIAWFEKQGKKKPIMNVPTREVILAIWDLGNEWKELTSGDISTEYGTQLDYIQKHWHESEYYLREKQGEQKVHINDFKAKNWYVSEVDGKIHDMTYNPADKVKPKFKVGYWIVNDQGSAFQIAYIDTENCRYAFEIGGYTKEEMNYENIAFANNHYREWTIADAKDGDVLVVPPIKGSEHSEQIFIFKEIKDREYVKNAVEYYCRCMDNEFALNERGFMGQSDDYFTPATKEQRNILFQRMKEAGYEWDAEKKVFKMIDENSKCDAVEYVYILDYSTSRVIVAKHNTEESVETLFDELGLKENQCEYMVSSDILSIEYINF